MRALDSLGRAGDPFTVTYTLIPAAPTTTSTPVNPGSSRTPTWVITNTVVDFDHYTCNSAVPVLSCTSTISSTSRASQRHLHRDHPGAVDSLGVSGSTRRLSGFSLIAPAPYVTAPPTSPASSRAPKWTIADDVVDFSRYHCTSSVTVVLYGSVVQLDLSGRVDGTYTVTVQAVDSHGVLGDPTT